MKKVAGVQHSSYWAHGRPEIKWVYDLVIIKSIHSVWYTSSISPSPCLRFSEGLVLDYQDLSCLLHMQLA